MGPMEAAGHSATQSEDCLRAGEARAICLEARCIGIGSQLPSVQGFYHWLLPPELCFRGVPQPVDVSAVIYLLKSHGVRDRGLITALKGHHLSQPCPIYNSRSQSHRPPRRGFCGVNKGDNCAAMALCLLSWSCRAFISSIHSGGGHDIALIDQYTLY